MFLWIKAFHLIFMVTWFAGLFYLPRLFVYHTMAKTEAEYDRFCVMERKLYYAITTPGAVLTLMMGLWMLYLYGWDWLTHTTWFQVKLGLILLLGWFHYYCGVLLNDFANHKNQKPEKFYRLINEIPVIPLIGIIILAVVKPF